LFLALLSQKEGPFQMCLFPRPPKPPRLRIAKMGTKAKIRWKGPAQRCHVDKKRKRVEEFASSSVSAHKTVAGETAAPEDDVELFDLMDS
jgi:hypothetical protein